MPATRAMNIMAMRLSFSLGFRFYLIHTLAPYIQLELKTILISNILQFIHFQLLLFC